jgi:hypothetical protein
LFITRCERLYDRRLRVRAALSNMGTLLSRNIVVEIEPAVL